MQKNRTILIVISLLVLATALFAVEEPQESYRLGPEDVISVTVVRHPEFSGDFLIPVDGKLSLPAVGQLEVTGQSIEQLSQQVTESLKSRLVNPEVTVSLKSPRMQRIYVLGAVNKPGLYDSKPGWRITEAVAAAGGITAGAESSDCTVSLLSTDGKKQTISFSSVASGASEANFPILNGDVLTIEAEATIPVYVMGKVKTPGLYRLRVSNPGLMEALTLAGGTLDEAAMSKISVTHISGASENVDLSAVTGGEPVCNPKLQSGDLVLVPESTSRMAVLGFVKSPGFYLLRDHQQITLADALGLAGGSDNKRGGTSSIAIIRTKEGKQEKLTYNLTKFLKSGNSAHNPVIMAGDVIYVPETNKLDWELVYRAISSVGVLINPFIN